MIHTHPTACVGTPAGTVATAPRHEVPEDRGPKEQFTPSYGPLTSAARDTVKMISGIGGALLKVVPGASEGAAEAGLAGFEISENTRNVARAGISGAIMAVVGVGVAHFATPELGLLEKAAAGGAAVVEGGVVLSRMPEDQRSQLRKTANNVADAVTPANIPGGQAGKIAFAAGVRAPAGFVGGGFEGLKDGFQSGERFGASLFDSTARMLGAGQKED